MKEKTTITHEDFLELSSDIAEAIVVNRIGILDKMSAEAMDFYWELFNENLDIIQQCFRNQFTIINQ
tara:strand:+ start:633 stop:833 length:201 start_codon:yes stop_codon:yes gene_type:complete